jgi:hypothetical protein
MRNRPEEYKEYQKLWSRANKDKRKAYADSYLERNPKKKLLKSSKHNAKVRGLEHTITENDIVIPEYCPYLGVKLSTTVNHRHCVSIDRIDSSLGYVPSNVEVISKLANRMKSDATKEELLAFCNNFIKKSNETT